MRFSVKACAHTHTHTHTHSLSLSLSLSYLSTITLFVYETQWERETWKGALCLRTAAVNAHCDVVET